MALNRPEVLPTWAETGDVEQPTNPEISEGWPLTNIPPPRQYFNWAFNYFMNGVRYLTRRGVPDWSSAETYSIGDTAIGPDNKPYRSLTDGNLNKTPATSPGNWKLWLSSVNDIPAATTADAGIAPLATAAEVVAKNANKIMTAAAFFGSSNIAANGHYDFPGGLVLNWGSSSVQDDGFLPVFFDKPFKTAVLTAHATPIRNGAIAPSNALGAHVGNISLNGMYVGISMYNGFAIAGAYWFAVGI
jgi:hypothetical protein